MTCQHFHLPLSSSGESPHHSLLRKYKSPFCPAVVNRWNSIHPAPQRHLQRTPPQHLACQCRSPPLSTCPGKFKHVSAYMCVRVCVRACTHNTHTHIYSSVVPSLQSSYKSPCTYSYSTHTYALPEPLASTASIHPPSGIEGNSGCHKSSQPPIPLSILGEQGKALLSVLLKHRKRPGVLAPAVNPEEMLVASSMKTQNSNSHLNNAYDSLCATHCSVTSSLQHNPKVSL